MSDVEVAVAAAHERVALENLFQLYIHDFSEHWFDRPEGELGHNGRFEDFPLDPYWSDPDHIPLLLRVKGHLVGFALLDRDSHLGGEVDRNMAEFFIVRKHRRGRVGTVAAQAIFSRYPGRWETAIVRRNLAALAFWRKAVTEHPAAQNVVETDLVTPAWNGPVLSFRIAAA